MRTIQYALLHALCVAAIAIAPNAQIERCISNALRELDAQRNRDRRTAEAQQAMRRLEEAAADDYPAEF